MKLKEMKPLLLSTESVVVYTADLHSSSHGITYLFEGLVRDIPEVLLQRTVSCLSSNDDGLDILVYFESEA